MKRIQLFWFFIIIFKLGISSPQVADFIIFKNDTIPICHLLVEEFLQQNESDSGRLFGLSFRNSINGNSYGSFNCWRGYQAIYKIENDSLFVCGIIDCETIDNFDQKSSVRYLKEIFKSRVVNNRVYIDWYTGIISFPIHDSLNKMLRWDGIFNKTYLFETILEIKSGFITKMYNVTNYTDLENGIDRFNENSIKSLLIQKIQTIVWKKFDDEDFFGGDIMVKIRKDGKVSKVKSAYSKDKVEVYYEDMWKVYRDYIRSLNKILKGVQFDIIKQRGKPIEEYIYIQIYFTKNGVICY